MSDRYIAVYVTSAFSGIGIIDIIHDIDDYCICEFYGTEETYKTKNKIYTDKNGRNYIRKLNRRYYLDEFLKK